MLEEFENVVIDEMNTFESEENVDPVSGSYGYLNQTKEN